MWFKNLKIFRLTEALNLDESKLQELLEELVFRDCGQQELASMGWVNPIGQGDSLYHAANGVFLFSLRKQERILPSRVVNRELDKKVAEVETEKGGPIGKKAKQDLKQEIVHKLLPRAFVDDTDTFGFVCPAQNLVIINSSSDSKAETFLAMFRKTIGSLPVVPLARESIAEQLTSWIRDGDYPSDKIEIMERAKLRDPADTGAELVAKNQDLFSDEIKPHLEAGKVVESIEFVWNDSVTLTLTSDVSVKGLKFSDVLREENDDIPANELAARIDADFALMSGELIKLSQWLDEHFKLGEDS